jgi:Immunity protein 53
MNDLLRRLQTWYLEQCDGGWEHENGVKVETIDNPGWMLSVDLRGTSAANVPFAPVEEQRSETDWVSCRIQSQRFEGFGGPSNLEELLLIFLNWVEANGPTPAA